MTIEQILKKRYPDNEYALLREVRDKAGFDASRSADYIAVSLWPSRGLSLNGIELKSGRGDWLSELKKPEKAENIFQYCDFFWLLTANETVAKMEEIPAAWGWLCVVGERIVIKKEAPKNEPKHVTRSFLCAMLKRACDKSDYVHKDSIQDKINEAKEAAMNGKEYKLERVTKELAEVNKKMQEFKEASGIDLARAWEPIGQIGKAVKLLQGDGVKEVTKELSTLHKRAQNIADNISEVLTELKPSTL